MDPKSLCRGDLIVTTPSNKNCSEIFMFLGKRVRSKFEFFHIAQYDFLNVLNPCRIWTITGNTAFKHTDMRKL